MRIYQQRNREGLSFSDDYLGAERRRRWQNLNLARSAVEKGKCHTKTTVLADGMGSQIAVGSTECKSFATDAERVGNQ